MGVEYPPIWGLSEELSDQFTNEEDSDSEH